MSGYTPRITAAERRENEDIRAGRKIPREEWAAVVIDDLGKRMYVADHSVTTKEFTTARGSARRFSTEAKAQDAAELARTFKRRREPRENEPVNVPHWEEVRRTWISSVEVERVR